MKSSCCPRIGPGFDSQRPCPCGSSQPSATRASGSASVTSAGTRYAFGAHTCIQAKHPSTQNTIEESKQQVVVMLWGRNGPMFSVPGTELEQSLWKSAWRLLGNQKNRPSPSIWLLPSWGFVCRVTEVCKLQRCLKTARNSQFPDQPGQMRKLCCSSQWSILQP